MSGAIAIAIARSKSLPIATVPLRFVIRVYRQRYFVISMIMWRNGFFVFIFRVRVFILVVNIIVISVCAGVIVDSLWASEFEFCIENPINMPNDTNG